LITQAPPEDGSYWSVPAYLGVMNQSPGDGTGAAPRAAAMGRDNAGLPFLECRHAPRTRLGVVDLAATSDGPVALGLDGCRTGWVAAVAYGSAGKPTRTALRHFSDIDELLAWRARQDSEPIVAVDVPMGLPDRVGLRPCDAEARTRLGRRWMCVFEPPDRELYGHDFESGRAIVWARRASDPEAVSHVLTQQGIQIMSKIEQVDRVLLADPRREEWLIEVHPEVSFGELAGEALPPKKSAAGKKARLALLGECFPDIDARLDAVPWLRTEVAYDDLLDAYISLWSALRFARGPEHCVELGGGELDSRGLRMRMIV
jgi:predicted RNase H-like nuclease